MELKAGYKQTEVGVIPEDWEVNTVQNLIDDNSIVGHLDGNHGALYPKSNEFKLVGVPYVGANDFYRGKVYFEKCKYVSPERASLFQKGIAKNGDVLFAHNATVGPVALLTTKLDFIILSTTATYFRCNIKILNNKYLLFALQASHFVRQYTSVMSQSTRFQVPISAQRKLSLVIPLYNEQTTIATALSDTDSWITSLEQLIAKKLLLKQGAMQELLKPKEGWEVKKLGDLLQFGSGRDYKHLSQGSIPVYGTGGIMTMVDDYLYEGESVGIGRKGTIDKPVFLKNKFWTVDTLFYTHSFINTIPKFIYYQFLQIPWKEYNEASGVPSLNKKTLEQIEITIPNLPEQTQIAKILSDMDAELTALEHKLEKAKKIKMGMMQELLTGRIRLV
jgi:type I restriction enzyme S subunit